MATSQNGRTVLTKAPPTREVPGTGVRPGRLKVRLSVAEGDDGWLLIEVARRFHEIEAIDVPVDASHGTRGVDDWGWAYRPVRGQESGFSNHASGTAIDLNAVKHPRGERGTFDNRTKAAILVMLQAFVDDRSGHCVIRWGEQYTTTIDGMHFEINGTRAQCERVAARLRADAARKDDEGGSEVALSDADKAWIKAQIPTAQQVADALLNTRTEVFRDGDGDGKRDVYTVRQTLAATPIAQTVADELGRLRRDLVAAGVLPAAEPAAGGGGGGGRDDG